jgi:hypothetical protein
MKDAFGELLMVGERIVYVRRVGSTVTLKRGIVTEVHDNFILIEATDNKLRKSQKLTSRRNIVSISGVYNEIG